MHVEIYVLFIPIENFFFPQGEIHIMEKTLIDTDVLLIASRQTLIDDFAK